MTDFRITITFSKPETFDVRNLKEALIVQCRKAGIFHPEAHIDRYGDWDKNAKPKPP